MDKKFRIIFNQIINPRSVNNNTSDGAKVCFLFQKLKAENTFRGSYGANKYFCSSYSREVCAKKRKLCRTSPYKNLNTCVGLYKFFQMEPIQSSTPLKTSVKVTIRPAIDNTAIPPVSSVSAASEKSPVFAYSCYCAFNW